MRTGRPRKPAELHHLHGTADARTTNRSQPRPPRARPRRPHWLDGMARYAWDELSGLLLDMRVLTVADRKALELLVDAYSEWRKARAVCIEKGPTYLTTTDRGSKCWKRRPEALIARDAWMRVERMLVQFGLTPATRSKVSAEPSDSERPGDFRRWLEGKQ